MLTQTITRELKNRPNCKTIEFSGWNKNGTFFFLVYLTLIQFVQSLLVIATLHYMNGSCIWKYALTIHRSFGVNDSVLDYPKWKRVGQSIYFIWKFVDVAADAGQREKGAVFVFYIVIIYLLMVFVFYACAIFAFAMPMRTVWDGFNWFGCWLKHNVPHTSL